MSLRIVTKSIWSNPGNRGQRLQRTMRAVCWQAWKRLVRKTLLISLPNGRRFVAHPDCVVSSALIYSRYPEFHEIQYIRRNLEPADAVIDVGANVGHIGLLLSDLVRPARIHAFEPTPITFQRLLENWSVNEFEVGALHQVALGDHEGTVLVPNLNHPGTMNSPIPFTATDDRSLVAAQLHYLDRYRDRWAGNSIGLLKIDVEGHEAEVLRGARRTLCEDQPRLIMFESLNNRVDPSVESELVSAGYQIFQLDNNGQPFMGDCSNQNLFAAPSGRIQTLMAS